MQLATLLRGLGPLLAIGVLGACAIGPAIKPPAPPPPAATLTVGSADDHGLYFMVPGQTLLLNLPSAYSSRPAILRVDGQYQDAVLFKATGLGRATVTGNEAMPPCTHECNIPAPLEIVVAVVSDLQLQQGLLIAAQDLVASRDLGPLAVHLRTGQRFELSLVNRPGAPAWGRLTSYDSSIIVPEQPAVVSAGGIVGRFRAGNPGRTGVWATGIDCPSANPCPQSPYAEFTFVVFAS